MSSNQKFGDLGEKEIVEFIACPNCGKKLVELPKNYPLYDVQCSGCYFRAQIKTSNSKPKPVIFGAGWQIMEKVLKAGYLIPPLFLFFKWEDEGLPCKEIRFYPFVPKSNLRKYKLSKSAKRANYWMFNYIGMDKIPYFKVLYYHSKPENLNKPSSWIGGDMSLPQKKWPK